MKKLLPLIFILLLFKQAAAQDFDFGVLDADGMDMKRYDKDTSAHAVVLREFGRARVSSNDGMPLVFDHHVKIKILDSKGFDHGNVSINLYIGDNDHFERVYDVAGITYYKDDAGTIQHTNL